MFKTWQLDTQDNEDLKYTKGWRLGRLDTKMCPKAGRGTCVHLGERDLYGHEHQEIASWGPRR